MRLYAVCVLAGIFIRYASWSMLFTQGDKVLISESNQTNLYKRILLSDLLPVRQFTENSDHPWMKMIFLTYEVRYTKITLLAEIPIKICLRH